MSAQKRQISDWKFEVDVLQRTCVAVDSPRSLALFLLTQEDGAGKYPDIDQALALKCDPLNYLDPEHFAWDYLATSMLKKSPNVPLYTNEDRKARAVEAFLKGNSTCRLTNERLLGSQERPEWYNRYCQWISKILGPIGPRQFDSIVELMRHGPGATTGVRGRGSVPSDKYDAEMHLTRDLLPFAASMMPEAFLTHVRENLGWLVVKGSRFFTVTKDYETDRGACCEPTLNVFGQLGCGEFIAERLRIFGCDIRDQTRNQSLASEAHTRGLATIDLSNASNTMASGLILDSFPINWFHLLDLLRSEWCEMPDGSWTELSMLSSMGNGYTFPVETLVFLSCIKAVVPEDLHEHCSVYGDDIIVPQECANAVVDALTFLGFSVNAKKSFLAGSFFESCGTDWFLGQNVRPFYLRGASGDIPYALQVANALRLHAKRLGILGCHSKLVGVWRWLKSLIPPSLRPTIPSSLGDTGLIVDKSEVRKLKKLVDRQSLHILPPGALSSYRGGWSGMEGWDVTHLYLKPPKKRKDSYSVVLTFLATRGFAEQASYGFETVRGLFGRLRRTDSHVVTWDIDLVWL
jgi:hypothetical protein